MSKLTFGGRGGGRGGRPHLAHVTFAIWCFVYVQNLVKIGSAVFASIKSKQTDRYIYNADQTYILYRNNLNSSILNISRNFCNQKRLIPISFSCAY